MIDVALVYPYVYKQARNAMLFYPLGVSQLSAILRKKGIPTRVFDATFQNFQNLPDKIARSSPKVVGIYVMMTMSGNARQLAAWLRKQLPDVILACGGPMPTLRPESFCKEFDFIFRGEAVESFPKFCGDYLESKNVGGLLVHPGRYPGIYHREMKGEKIVQSSCRSCTEQQLDQLPLPDISDYDHDQYRSFWDERELFRPACIMTTFGCPFDCEFCSKPIFGRNFRRRSMDKIMAEIDVIRTHGYDGL